MDSSLQGIYDDVIAGNRSGVEAGYGGWLATRPRCRRSAHFGDG
jgi:hypothetical protein